MRNNRIIKYFIYFCLLFIGTLSICSCATKNPDSSNNNGNINADPNKVFINDYQTVTKVGYEMEILGTVKRNIPKDEYNEGLSKYPTYGTTLTDLTVDDKIAIITESSYLTSVGTIPPKENDENDRYKYNRMDKDGYLYMDNNSVLDKNGKKRKLYKHTASIGMFEGEISDDEKAVIKKITMTPRSYSRGYGVTGLYAAPGEVIKIEISKQDMESTDGIDFHIGQALYNGQANNIWETRELVRMPHILNTMKVNKDLATYDELNETYTAYIGSFLGGPIYIRNENVKFSVTISGALEYSHFILGYTTEEEFNLRANSTVPYFDLEVWDSGVLHSGPKKYAEKFDYDDLYNAAVLWDKISLTSTQVNNQGIVFLYDPFVAAGSAVAFPGRGSVNCPCDWMTSSLDYDSFIQNGSWGNIHEYNHNFQGWGLGDGVEVTNNALSLVSFGLYTNISAKRKLGDFYEGMGSDWIKYTNPSWVLRDITSGKFDNGKKGLSVYANYYHSFGADVMLESIKNSNGEGVDKWFKSTMDASGYNMTYYYRDLIGLNVSDDMLLEASAKNYPMYVPVSSIYQTGMSFVKDGKKISSDTTRPYQIEYGKEFTIDLGKYTMNNNNEYISGSIVIPDGFSYKVKSVSNPANGKIAKVSDTIYKYIPNDKVDSGKIYVTLEITKDDNAFKVDDVELVFEFQNNKNTLDRTIYTFDDKFIYNNSAKEAYENNYKGYKNKETVSNLNPVQDCNAEIWFNEKPNPCQVLELNGKYYIKDAGKYRLALRGRFSCALYASTDGENYSLAGEYYNYETDKGISHFTLKPGTYTDYDLKEGSWLYFKAILKCWDTDGKNSFVGVGLGKFDYNGNVNINKANAYNVNSNYDAKDDYSSEYYYTRDYKYSYKDNVEYKGLGNIISYENYTPWDAKRDDINNMIDGNKDTYLHTNYNTSPDKPLIITVDCGKEVLVNRLTLFTQNRSDPHCPISFKLEGSKDNVNWFVLGDYENLKMNNYSVVADFTEASIRYYRLSITKSSNQYIIISEAELARVFEINDGKHISLDSNDVLMKGYFEATNILSSFGHSYNGIKDSSIEFEFIGNRFGILSNDKIGSNFEVYIDDKKVNSIDLKKDNGVIMSFISDELKSGKHIVKIKCLGDCNIDSLVYW